MADVFISYHENSAGDIARQISEELEKDGVSCWYAGRDMEKDALRGVITKAIRDCRVFLLILNESALKSAYVQTEVALVRQGFADHKKRDPVTFRTDNCNFSEDENISAFWKQCRIRITDDHTSHENGILSLKGALKTILCEPTTLKILDDNSKRKPSFNRNRITTFETPFDYYVGRIASVAVTDAHLAAAVADTNVAAALVPAAAVADAGAAVGAALGAAAAVAPAAIAGVGAAALIAHVLRDS